MSVVYDDIYRRIPNIKPKEVKDIKKLSDEGDSEAHYVLGLLYYYGFVIEQDYEKSVYYYNLSAKQGNAKGYYGMGKMYEQGKFIKKNKSLANQCYLKCVKIIMEAPVVKDFVEQNMLGNIFYFGNGVEKDYKSALYWFTMSAKQDYSKAQYRLGNLYYYGRGVNMDYDRAVEYYKQSAENGNSKALLELGVCSKLGNGLPQSDSKAKKYWKKALKLGNHKAKAYIEEYLSKKK
ncbi:MAG: tetratricopeptide repeat protein [Clostridia bacterium]